FLTSGWAAVAEHMGKQRLAHGKLRRLFQFQQPWQHASIAAAIQDEFRLDRPPGGIGLLDGNSSGRLLEVHRGHTMAVANLHTARSHGIDQRFIKIGVRHLERIFPSGRKLAAEIKIARLMVPQKYSAVFTDKCCCSTHSSKPASSNKSMQ